LTPPPRPTANSEADGFLQLFEIAGLSLSCDLAVLSACETNVGPQVEGEGTLALSRAFQVAGARRTISTLWIVDDQSTAALLTALFERIATQRRSGVIDYALALRDAKRSVRSRDPWSEPYHWAPFVLSGIR